MSQSQHSWTKETLLFTLITRPLEKGTLLWRIFLLFSFFRLKKVICTSPSESFALYQKNDGAFFCPVCGGAGFITPPYEQNGAPSFQMCDCGFEFGFDDSPLASGEAVDGIRANWKRWRRKVIEKAAQDPAALARLEEQLKNIGVRLAFDLIDVQED